MKLSIIVPVYNAERYLDTTVGNILNQTFTDFELLLIDDGSEDGSGRLCDLWSRKDSRVRVIRQKNAGVGTARNTGLDAARGEYIGFADNDDFLHPQMFEILLKTAEKEDADIVMSKEKKLWEAAQISFDTYDGDAVQYSVLNKEDRFRGLFSYSVQDGPYIHIWNKVYKRSLLEGVRFSTQSTEDGIFNRRVYGMANKFVLIEDNVNLYYWIVRSSSLSHNLSGSYYSDYTESYYFMTSEMMREFPEYSHYALEKTFRILLSVRYTFRKGEKRRQVRDKVKSCYQKLKKPFYRDKKIKPLHKAVIWLFYRLPFVYTLVRNGRDFVIRAKKGR